MLANMKFYFKSDCAKSVYFKRGESITFSGKQCIQKTCDDQYIYNKQCITKQECDNISGYYTDQKLKQCRSCKVDNCAKCSKSLECKQCDVGYKLIQGNYIGDCQRICKYGEYYNEEKSQCFNCPSNTQYKQFKCKRCDLNQNKEKCDLCFPPLVLQEYSCQDKCESGYILNKSNNICEQCEQQFCHSCLQSDKVRCLECQRGYFLTSERKCIKDCISGDNQVMVINLSPQKCIVCPPHCLKCELEFECLQCEPNFKMQFPQCQLECNPGYYAEDNICKQCEPPCKECQNSKNECLSCLKGNYFPDSNSCNFPCPEGYYQKFNSEDQIECLKCYSNCKGCRFKADKCATCHGNLVLHQYRCEESCPEKFYLVQGSDYQVCYSCSLFCQTCVNSFKCSTCVDHTYLDKATHQCIMCHQSCSQCYGPNQNDCIFCRKDQVLENNKCLSECSPGYNHNGIQCIKIVQLEQKEEVYYVLYAGSVTLLFIIFMVLFMMYYRKRKQLYKKYQNQSTNPIEIGLLSSYSQKQQHRDNNIKNSLDIVSNETDQDKTQINEDSQSQQLNVIVVQQEQKKFVQFLNNFQIDPNNKHKQITANNRDTIELSGDQEDCSEQQIETISLDQFRQMYKKIERLGEGTFGVVEKYVSLKTKRPVAIKRFKFMQNEACVSQGIKEAMVLKTAGNLCKNVIKLEKFFYIEKNSRFIQKQEEERKSYLQFINQNPIICPKNQLGVLGRSQQISDSQSIESENQLFQALSIDSNYIQDNYPLKQSNQKNLGISTEYDQLQKPKKNGDSDTLTQSPSTVPYNEENTNQKQQVLTLDQQKKSFKDSLDDNYTKKSGFSQMSTNQDIEFQNKYSINDIYQKPDNNTENYRLNGQENNSLLSLQQFYSHQIFNCQQQKKDIKCFNKQIQQNQQDMTIERSGYGNQIVNKPQDIAQVSQGQQQEQNTIENSNNQYDYQINKNNDEQSSDKSDKQLVLILEIADCSLNDKIQKFKKTNQQFPQVDIISLLQQMSQTLCILHYTLSIAHRDIKPQNILIVQQNFKLCDLGVAKWIKNSLYVTHNHSLAGTLNYISPEEKQNYILMIQNCQQQQQPYNPYLSDIFSLGLTLYEIVTLKNVVGLNDNQELLANAIQTNLKSRQDINPQLIQIIISMLAWDPTDRLTSKQIAEQFN